MERLDPMNQARKRLILSPNSTFWAVLSLRLEIEPNVAVGSAATDGRKLYYNPEWFNKLALEEQEAVVAHEISHCALEHPWRIGSREPGLANEAADHVINLDLAAAGFHLPVPHLANPRFQGMSFEAVYDILFKEREQGPKRPAGGQGKGQGSKTAVAGAGGSGAGKTPTSGDGDGLEPNTDQNSANSADLTVGKTDNPANWGTFTHGAVEVPEPPKPGQPQQPKPAPEDLQREWQKAVEMANLVASKAGYMPAGLKRSIEENRRKKEDLTETLQRFLRRSAEMSFSRPNKRLLHRGLCLPGPIKSGLENVVIGVDTSGSIGQTLLSYFAEKLNEVAHMDTPPRNITVIYCDAEVQRVDHFVDGENVTFDAAGGGGTKFQPIFDELENLDIQPDVLIFCTDLDNYGEELTEPECPVLWVVPQDVRKEMPWGEIIRVDPHQ